MLFKKILSFIVFTTLGMAVKANAASVSEYQSSFTETPSPVQVKFEVPKSYKIPLARVYYGQASWYGPGFSGNRTASGSIFRPNAMTAAHRSLPFGTRVRVTNLNNGRSQIVTIDDRGPFVGGRIIDLSEGAARVLGMKSSGVATVRVEVLN